MKKISTGIDLLKVRYMSKKVPVFISISLTDRCNFRCDYCDAYKRKTKEMSAEEVKRCIDEFREMGTRKVGFCGGEPTLRKDLGELIDHAKSKGMLVTTTSNGFLVPKRIEEIKNLDILILSLDGPEDVQDSLRCKGSYDKIIKSLELCRDRGIKVWTITVLTKKNIKHVDFILDLAEEYGFHTIFQPVYNYLLYKGTLKGLAPSREEFKRAIEKVMERKKKGSNVASSFDYLDSILSWPNIKRKTKCWAGRSYCYIDTQGEVYPCIDLIGKVKAENGLEVGFRKAFESMAEIDCKGCWINCYLENDLITAIKPKSILNVIRNV